MWGVTNNRVLYYSLIFLLLSTSTYAFAGGDGTAGNPYQISTYNHLDDVRNDLNAHYILINDIDAINSTLESGGWSPIGSSSNRFAGSFKGQGHSISNIYINRSSSVQGLFARIDSSGQVTNTIISNATIQGISSVGIVAGNNNGGIIRHVIVQGTVVATTTTTSYAGGVVGTSHGLIENTQANVNVSGLEEYIGGITGRSNSGGEIISSSSKGSVISQKTSSSAHIGGLVGYQVSDSVVRNSYSNANVTTQANQAGGLVGNNHGSIENSYATGAVSGADYVGGVVGSSSGTIRNSFSTGAVSGTGSLVGAFGGNIYGTLAENFFFNFSQNPPTCSGASLYGSPHICTGSTNVNYFFNYSNEPINNWNFETSWDDFFDGQQLPILNSEKKSFYAEVLDATAINDTALNVSTQVTLSSVDEVNLTVEYGITFGDSFTGENTTETQILSGNGTIHTTISNLPEGANITVRPILTVNNNRNTGFLFRTQLSGTYILFDAGNGSLTNPYQISNILQLQSIKNNLTANYELIANVSVTEDMSFERLGGSSDRFEGNFDGKGNQITYADNIFFYIGENATVFNLNLNATGQENTDFFIDRSYGTLNNVSITASPSMTTNTQSLLTNINYGNISNAHAQGSLLITGFFGTLSYSNPGIIDNSSVQVNISQQTSSHDMGGIVFSNSGNITNTVFVGNVSVTQGASSVEAGGLTASNSGNIIHSYSQGHVKGSRYTGGLVAKNSGTIYNSYSTSNVHGTGYVGGLVGRDTGIINQSYATGDVTSTSGRVGGLVGEQRTGSQIIESFATGDVTTDSFSVGGLVGSSSAPIINSYATGDVQGDRSVGGLVGGASNQINNSYATGDVTESVAFSGSAIGGLIGFSGSSMQAHNVFATGVVEGDSDTGSLVGELDGTLTNAFVVSSEKNCIGSVVGSCTEVSEEELLDILSEPLASWNFEEVWNPSSHKRTAPTLLDNNPIIFLLLQNETIQFTPDTKDELDPNSTLNFTVNITSLNGNVTTATLEWKNLTGSWSNASSTNLTNTTTVQNTTAFTASVQVPPQEQDLLFRVVARDEKDEIGILPEKEISFFWDCGWSLSPTQTGPFGGFAETKNVYNMTLNNTGDAGFANGCVLDFTISYNLDTGRIFYNGQDLKGVTQIRVPPQTASNVNISANFLDEVQEEQTIVSVEEFRGFAEASSSQIQNSSFTLVSAQDNPFLSLSLEEVGTVFLTPQAFEVNGTISNVFGDEYPALNVTLNWSIPDSITTLSNTTKNFSQIANTSNLQENVLLELTQDDLKSLRPGKENISLLASGFNASGDVITHQDNRTIQKAQRQIVFECYSEKDGFCVPACGSEADPDCPKSVKQVGGGGGGGGSGGGGGGGSAAVFTQEEESQLFTTEESFEIVRGGDQSFSIKITNPVNDTLYNLTYSLEGFQTQYLSFEPKTSEKLSPNEYENITVEIIAPEYFSETKYDLTFTMEGELRKETFEERENVNISSVESFPVLETRTIDLYIQEISTENTTRLINETGKIIEELSEKGFSVKKTNQILQKMSEHFEQKEYSEIKKMYDQLVSEKNDAETAKTTLQEVREGVNQATLRGIETPKTNRLVTLSEQSLLREEFTLAKNRALEATSTLTVETLGKFNLLFFIQNNIKMLLLIAIVSAVMIWQGILASKYVYFDLKTSRYEAQEEVIIGLIKQLQRETFEESKVGMDEYVSSVTHYESQLNRAIINLIKTKSKKEKIYSFKKRITSLHEERKELISLIREAQTLYLEGGRIETTIYHQKIKSYSERLAEIEEEIASYEAKKELRLNK